MHTVVVADDPVDLALDAVLLPYFRRHFAHFVNNRVGSDYFSITLPHGFPLQLSGSAPHIQTLSSVLGTTVVQQQPLNELPFAQRSDGCRQLFFNVVRFNPHMGQRVKVRREQGFQKHTIAISVQKVVKQSTSEDENVIVQDSSLHCIIVTAIGCLEQV